MDFHAGCYCGQEVLICLILNSFQHYSLASLRLSENTAKVPAAVSRTGLQVPWLIYTEGPQIPGSRRIAMSSINGINGSG